MLSLCKTLGGMTFSEMLDRMSADEVNLWRAYCYIENEEAEWQREKAKPK